jgi:AAA15 family ATPase/GTPase
MDKIEEAQQVLHDLGLPEQQQNKVCALTLLALAGLKPGDAWHSADGDALTLSRDIIDFVNHHYGQEFKENTRESFRKQALNPFVQHRLVNLNPDDPGRPKTSPNTHYALTQLVVETIRKFDTSEWEDAITYFRFHQFEENQPSRLLLRKVTIKNFKSILNESLELGRFNVFIGANGCGKTNILEALAAVGAVKDNNMTFEGLYNRGVRMARPDLLLSSFWDTPTPASMEVNLVFDDGFQSEESRSAIYPENVNDIYTRWLDRHIPDYIREEELPDTLQRFITDIYREQNAVRPGQISADELMMYLNERIAKEKISIDFAYRSLIADYAIFDVNTRSIRGITASDSRKTPLGLNGEGLDVLISTFNSYERETISKCQIFFDWLKGIVTDKGGEEKMKGLKAGRSNSILYFTDKYMQAKNNMLSAENSNEGILHALFYLALFVSNKTPDLFAIDNIETALNPKLCEVLIKELVQLSATRGKQVLITTHNPAILDGLNLRDDEQRLFTVFRNIDGHTKTKRVQFKPDYSDKTAKLSEMWTRGVLGAVPKNF